MDEFLNIYLVYENKIYLHHFLFVGEIHFV